MKQKITDFDRLISDALDHLCNQLKYRPSSVLCYKRHWAWIGRWMEAHKVYEYSTDIEVNILEERFAERTIASFTKYEKEFYNSVKMFSDFVLKKEICISPRMVRKVFDFEDVVGRYISEYITYKEIHRASKITLRAYRRYLKQFNNYCELQKVEHISQITLSFVLGYLTYISHRKGYPVGAVLSAVRNFIKHLCDQKIISEDYYRHIPRYRQVVQPKLPSTYTKEEINQLLMSISRFGTVGKRNYAVVLIAARLGLRASDIACLKFENLHWASNTIRLRQIKTGKEIVLPLLADVGNAIVDYLKYGRPHSDSPYVFLTHRPPYGRFETSNVVTHIVQRAFLNAGITINGRRFGPHSLRHTLGFRMLEESTVLPVISEVLGHSSSESTRYYLRIDLHAMKQCMLDVPPVCVDFYSQKGGAFYA